MIDNDVRSQKHIVNVLLVARPNRFRDGLRAIVQALSWVDCVDTVDAGTAVSVYLQQNHPALVIYDMSVIDAPLHEEIGDCGAMKCLAIIDHVQHREMAQAMGVDAILLRGFSTDLLYQTMRSLVVAYDPAVVVTGSLPQLRT